MSLEESEPGPQREPPPFVTGDNARAWFYRLRGGGTVLDRHLELVQQFFGSDVPYRVTASVNRWSGRPTQLFIEIDRPVDDDAAQDRLIELQRVLVEGEDELAERSQRRRPFGNISLVLTGSPTRWDAVSDVLRDESNS